jgi:hypothetical protein
VPEVWDEYKREEFTMHGMLFTTINDNPAHRNLSGQSKKERCSLPTLLGRYLRNIVGVLDRQTYQGGTRGSRLCGEDHNWEIENSKVCARTRDTRFIQVWVAKVANPTSCLGEQVWRPALGVG